MKRITGLHWPLSALAACLLASSLAGAFWIDHFDDRNVGVMLLIQSVPYALAAWLIVKGKSDEVESGRALMTILVVGIVMRLLLFPGWPVSTDIYRYVWDGRVQGGGINPYLHLPADPALSGLRDGAVYRYINRADYAPTIYPPMSQIVFYLVTRVSDAPAVMKAAMLAFEALAIWAILQLLAGRGLPRSRILLYLWHPLPLWEFARSGHVDIAAVALLLVAFLAIERRSPILAGFALAAGALVKYFPIVTGPALYRRWDWRLPAAFVAGIVALYLPYLGAGPKVLGFLGSYMSEEGIDRGAGIFLWQLLDAIAPLPPRAFSFYLAAAALVTALLATVVVMRDQRPGADLAGAMLLAVTSTILFSPHYAWYFAWLVPFVCFYPVIGVIYLTCASGYLYFAHWPPSLSDGLVIYGPCILLLVAEFTLRGRRKLEERHVVPA